MRGSAALRLGESNGQVAMLAQPWQDLSPALAACLAEMVVHLAACMGRGRVAGVGGVATVSPCLMDLA